MTPPPPPVEHASEDGSLKGWSACAKAMEDYDDSMLQNWKEEIDSTLLL
jgi:hypothetical protein